MSKASLSENMRLNQIVNSTSINKVIQAVNYKVDELRNKGDNNANKKTNK